MFDRMTLQVLANHARAAAENMAHTLHRTAHSAFVKETQDFTVMLMDRAGQTFAVPMELGATWYPGLTYGRAIDMVDDYRPGDVAFTNDPYSGHVATHAPDTHLWKPIFADGEIVAWSGGHIHNTDMGGAVPASLSRALTEIHQEGLRFPPMKLVNEGVFDAQILRIMSTNVRKPDLNIGDIRALVGALNTGERKVHAMIAKFGKAAFLDGVAGLLDHAEAQARAVLAAMPDGTWEFADYADEDSEKANPCRLKLRLTIRGDEAILDFTGSDPQLASSLNVPSGGDPRHTMLLVGVYYVLYTLNPQILLNTGLTRPFTCIAPEGTVLNPVAPAAVGMRSLTCARLRSVIFGAFSQAVPDRLPAAPAGNNCIVNVMTTDDRSRRTVIAAVNPVVGGGGGMPHRDGTNGSGADAAYLKNTPIEITETETPVEFVKYGLARDSGGPGRWRGGLATEMAFRVFAPDTRITARNRDRSFFRPWGVLGGRAAGLSDMVVNPGTPDERRLGNVDTAVLQPGDVLEIRSAGGGGRGDPMAREPWRVAEDVARGYVSAKAAERDYGVVLRDGTVDGPATAALRARATPAPGHFHFGPERDGYEAQWTPAAYDALTAILSALPIHWRFFAKTEIFARMEGRTGAEGVAAAFEAVCTRFPELPRPRAEAAEAAE
ncbi:hydantoin utilization protein B [Rhodovulum sp. BSW8]|uniref:Hydantoinase B/oxoprolinase family protein n=1 Tax=Rhodovulum visakhapatnamense TaxID=364297 RepID=A0A4R8FIZ2_9RHOB|nr:MULTISPECIES: hydantoinase B/oxoprolinase family protein [Rhodovulum]OLS43607.1 hydantoin utilization protein B [Rhodovulum sulfidophilum]MBL3569858.1 hydantoinase B/oxoprolinase family protein [Rhodovulum visakhapatnamense]MBL3577744.1 hydantoinase B/oxoprolinase family protein [Rhodovulum visakhapatnamense]RBO51288.1 hydantoin utilization protein B [Rhodovulum sp. BSW8]TDX26120.1 N-methylhydantoinase B [Rhodovulum visakhapatnamense]